VLVPVTASAPSMYSAMVCIPVTLLVENVYTTCTSVSWLSKAVVVYVCNKVDDPSVSWPKTLPW
jgi:hypothetical protein